MDIINTSTNSEAMPWRRQRPPKLGDIRMSQRIYYPDEGSDNLSNIVDSLRLKCAVLSQHYSSRDPTPDSLFSKEESDNPESDISSEDLDYEQEFTSTNARNFHGCAREILDELDNMISDTTPVRALTSQGMVGETWLRSILEYYHLQQVDTNAYALDCIAFSLVDSVITKSIMFVMIEAYKEQEQYHLREIMDTIDETFPKSSGCRIDTPYLTSAMLEVHVKGRLKHFQKKLDKVQANNCILDWVQGTQSSDKKAVPHQKSIVSWMVAATSSSSSSSSSSSGDEVPASRIKSVPTDQQNIDANMSQNLSELFDPRQSISDVTFSFSRQASRDLSMLLRSEPSIYRKHSDSSSLSLSYPSNLTDKGTSGSIEYTRSLGRGRDSSLHRQHKSSSSHQLIEELQIQPEQNNNVFTEGTTGSIEPQSVPVVRENMTSKDSFEGVKMRQIRGRGNLLRKYSSTLLHDSNISTAVSNEDKQFVEENLDKSNQDELSNSQNIQPTHSAQPRGFPSFLKSYKSSENVKSTGKCVELDPRGYTMPSVLEVDRVEQDYLDWVHKDIMRSKRLNKRSLVPSLSSEESDFGPDSVTMPPPLSDSFYKIYPDINTLEAFEMFEKDWRKFQVAFEADVFSTRHRLKQNRISMNRKLQRVREYSTSLNDCVALVASSQTQDKFNELEETFHYNLSSLNSLIEGLVVAAQMVGCLSQEYKDNANFQLCLSYVDKLKSRSNTRDTRSRGRSLTQSQDSIASNASDSAIMNEDFIISAIERFMTQPALERRWPSFRKDRTQFTEQQSQLSKDLEFVIKRYDQLVECSKRDLRWSRIAIKLILFILLLLVLLMLTSESLEHSFWTLLKNLMLI